MNEYNQSIFDSEEWKKAEHWFGQIYKQSSFSLFGDAPLENTSPEALDEELTKILAMCPYFFPALMQRGFNQLTYGSIEDGEAFIRQGVSYMVRFLTGADVFARNIAPVLEKLENLLRYDIAVFALEEAIRVFPLEASLYDELAYFYLHVPGNHTRALQYQEKSLELDPGNEYYVNNLGWVHLQMANLKDAEECFRKAAEFDPDNQKAWENLETAEYMIEHGLNYFQYLMRPVDWKPGEFEDPGDTESLEDCRHYNLDRLEAFRVYHLENKSLKPHEILETVMNVEMFTNAVEALRTLGSGPFLYENPDMFLVPFRGLLVGFIEESVHVESEYLQEIGESLDALYDFLGKAKLISASRAGEFRTRITSTVKEFAGKLDEYYRVSHDIKLSEPEREEHIARLFGVSLA